MNNNSIKKNLTKIVINTLFFTLILFTIHKYIQYHFFKDTELFHPIYAIYTFLFLSFVLLFYFILKAAYIKPDTVFITFAVGSFLKSAGAVLFFLPLFFNETSNINLTVFNFFIPYFLFLFYEIYYVLQSFKNIE